VQLRAARQNVVVMGDQMRRAWEDFVAAECAAHPVVLVLEDLQWGDVPTTKLVDAALRRVQDQPLLVLALARPDVAQLFPNLWAGRPVTQLQLSDLSRKAGEKLVKQVLGDGIEPALIARLLERAAGNAFYLEELIRAVADGKGDELPQTVLAMVQARLEGLEPESRRVLRAASLYGQVFWESGVAALLGDDARGADERLADLVERELVERRGEGRFPDEQEYVFRHAIVREAAYSTLTDEDLVLGHRLAGEWLEKHGEQDAMSLGEHCELGRERERAIPWYVRAAEQALEANDFDAAVKRAERAVACGAGGPVLGALRAMQAEACAWRGEYEQAERVGNEALALLPEGSDAWCEAAGPVATASGTLGHNDRLREIVAQLDRLSGPVGRARVSAMTQTITRLVYAGFFEDADRLLAHLDRAAPDPVSAGAIWDARARREVWDPANLAQLGLQAAAAYEEAGNARGACRSRGLIGYAYLELGAYAEAEELLRTALAQAERLGLVGPATTAKHNLGLTLANLGHMEEGLAVEREAVAACVEQGERRIGGVSRCYVSRILAMMGDLEGAEREARAAIDMLGPIRPSLCCALAILAELLLAMGRVEEGARAAHEAMALLNELGAIDEGESAVRLVFAEAINASGDRAGALAAIREARTKLEARAARIRDAEWRGRFLHNVASNARTLEVAALWEGAVS
jgi:tetratricopeptide (TPR) repeat protein